MGGDILSEIREGGILYIILLVAICMHEFGHAYVADKLGDRLPRLQGRVSLNPLAHMDLLGTVILPILTIALSMGTGFPLVFGWGKPVQVLLDNPATRMKVDLLSTAGGVGMNLVVAAISALFMGLILLFGRGGLAEDFAQVALLSVQINCVLFVINMIPVPPLDGSHFLKYAVGMSDALYARISQYGIIILLVLINVPAFAHAIHFAVSALSGAFLLITRAALAFGG
ncbi:MAG: site-2 protease family protein [Verrucomicrobia bacterium]|nr:MAG: site-2 protease family protein [Verrucomicrobiota bacterium]